MAKEKIDFNIAQIVKGVFTDLEGKGDLTKEKIEDQWAAAAGEKAAKHSRPMSFRKQVLTVFVDNPGWIQVLTINKREILKGLKQRLGKDRITDIRFKTGDLNG